MHTDGRRPRLTPAIADVRRAVRTTLAAVSPEVETDAPGRADLLVALSGGPDSLALAAATAFEAPRAGLRAGAIIVDHGLQDASAEVAERAADQARQLGLAPVIVTRVDVAARQGAPAADGETAGAAGGAGAGGGAPIGGPEAAARDARYAAIDDALSRTGARAVLLGHTLDDQAETVLLGLARGAGAASLSGMARITSPEPVDPHHPGPAAAGPGGGAAGAVGPAAGAHARGSAHGGGARAALRLRPLLGIRRATTEAFCADSGLEPWHDPHNTDPVYTRVRVRRSVLPLLERELGPGIAEALARTADQLREDDETLHEMAIETIEDLVEHAEAGIAISAGALAANPPALRNRIIRYVIDSEFGLSLSRTQTLAVAALATDWHGQKGVDLPGIRVVRHGGLLVASRPEPEPRSPTRSQNPPHTTSPHTTTPHGTE